MKREVNFCSFSLRSQRKRTKRKGTFFKGILALLNRFKNYAANFVYLSLEIFKTILMKKEMKSNSNHILSEKSDLKLLHLGRCQLADRGKLFMFISLFTPYQLVLVLLHSLLLLAEQDRPFFCSFLC